LRSTGNPPILNSYASVGRSWSGSSTRLVLDPGCWCGDRPAVVERGKQEDVMSRTVIVIVIAVVVVLIVLAVVTAAVKKGGERKRDRARSEAADMRGDAAAEERTVRTHEAEAAEQEALARQARAESDRKAAAADRLQMQADERGEHASAKRDEHRDRLRAADDLDPDVPERERSDDRADEGRHGHGREAQGDRGGVDGAQGRTGSHPAD